eukprot:TCONS_00032045-protein
MISSWIMMLSLTISFLIFTPIYGRPQKYKKNTRRESSHHGMQTHLQTTCPSHPPLKDIDHKRCMQVYDSCGRDMDCGIGMKCCFDGCVYMCTEPIVKKTKTINKMNTPLPPKVSGNSWQIESNTRLEKKVTCSTSNFTDHEPIPCPKGYMCDIQRHEDEKNSIPNRGFCIKNPFKKVDPFKPMVVWDNVDTGCYYRGRKLKDGEYFFNKCNFCFCSNTIINCQTAPCHSTKRTKLSRLPISYNDESMNYI